MANTFVTNPSGLRTNTFLEINGGLMSFLQEFQPDNAEHLFTAHGQVFPLLAGGNGSELVFMTYDMQNIVRYISPSSTQVCRVDPAQWLHHSLTHRMTDRPGNSDFLNAITAYEYDRVYRDQCEIFDEIGNRVGLTFWRRLIVLHGTPIGVVAIAKRIEEPVTSALSTSDIDPVSIRKKIATLTRGEREVIDMVIQGQLNKAIASNLKIAMRTVESRRSKAMSKMGVTRLAELVRIWIAATEGEM
jgi:DNA-binding CsgD family transcriptional regulator